MKPIDYIPPEGLLHALDGARSLGQPLLLTGEPGTGKTSLADWAVAYLNAHTEKDFYPETLRFQTKTTSIARDLFYQYDALSHYQAVNLSKTGEGPEAFIELQALGRAIAMTNPSDEYPAFFRTKIQPVAQNSVVLIDEIDKAPRDFTNDILDEIDQKRFSIKEKNQTISKGEEGEIVIIMTSNSEKNLPDAFLRRCAFFHIEFPKGERLRQIVKRHLGEDHPYTGDAYDRLIALFTDIRGGAERKKPATAELIGWLRILAMKDYLNLDGADKKTMLKHNLSFLIKTESDLKAAQAWLEGKKISEMP